MGTNPTARAGNIPSHGLHLYPSCTLLSLRDLLARSAAFAREELRRYGAIAIARKTVGVAR